MPHGPTTGTLARVRDYVEKNRARMINELSAICRLESVSATGRSLRPAAEAVGAALKRSGLEVSLVDSGGQPVVVGRAQGRSERTILFYNHYDVQPPEPLEAWTSPPFEPELRDGRLYARGAADNKGNLMARAHAVETLLREMGRLPVSVIFVIEGEEETGSPSLPVFVRDNAGWLGKVDGVVWEAGYRDADGRPTLSLGVKGICYLELVARGATSDLHSSLGGLVPNPAWRLVWALSTIKDVDERILVEGFGDAVRPPDGSGLELLRTIPDTARRQAETHGLGSLLGGLEGEEANRQAFYQPTATICGFVTGYTGPGAKTVLPSTASAKLDFRLVPDQDPADIGAKVRAHLKAHGFGDIEVNDLAAERPARTDPAHPFVSVARRAMREVYGRAPIVYPTMPGSGPMALFAVDLGLPVVGFGVGHLGSAVHAPDENIFVEDYLRGVEMAAALLIGAGDGGWTV